MPSPRPATSFTYDSNGNCISLLDPYGGRVTYGYDAKGQVTSLQDNATGRSTMIYDAAGRYTLRLLSDGTRVSYIYDAANQVTELTNLESGGTLISRFQYEYDAAGTRRRRMVNGNQLIEIAPRAGRRIRGTSKTS